MRVRLKGINSVKKRLADGTVKIFWYAWKSGPPLRGVPGTPEFIASYNDAVAKRHVTPEGTILSILQKYQASDAFMGRRFPALMSVSPREPAPTTSSRLLSSRRNSVPFRCRDWVTAVRVASSWSGETTSPKNRGAKPITLGRSLV